MQLIKQKMHLVALNVYLFGGNHVKLSTLMSALPLSRDDRLQFNSKLYEKILDRVMYNLQVTNHNYFTNEVIFSLDIHRYMYIAKLAILRNGDFTFEQMVHNVIIGAFEYIFLMTNLDDWIEDMGFAIVKVDIHKTLHRANVLYILQEMMNDNETDFLTLTDDKRKDLSIRIMSREMKRKEEYQSTLNCVRRVYELQPLSTIDFESFCRRSWGNMKLATYVMHNIHNNWQSFVSLSRKIDVYDWAN